jgi:regulator of sigma E protease
MDLIAQLPLIGPFMATVIPFLIVLAIVVFVHEYGHYIVGQWCGIGAEAFSIGFGREITGWTDKRGTRWRVGLLPLGGYVKFLGDTDASSSHVDAATLAGLSPEQRAHSFHTASVERRALTVAAGPAANFLLSIAIFAIIALFSGVPADGPVIGEIGEDASASFREAVAPGDRVLSVDGETVEDFAGLQAALMAVAGQAVEARVARPDGREETVSFTFRVPARIDAVIPGGAADEAGLEPGDVVTAVDGEPIAGFTDLQQATAAAGGAPMTLTIRRGNASFDRSLTPRLADPDDPESRPLLGIQKQSSELLPQVNPAGPLSALGFGVSRTWQIISLSITGIGSVIAGDQAAEDVLGGPIRIAEVSGQAASEGAGTFIGLIAVLSASIGLINLFPIPILDGGHLMFYAFEKLRGTPLDERWQEIGNRIGLALVLSLMVFATFNDIARL